MSRDSSTFKDSYNRALDLINEIGPAGLLPTETSLSGNWDVSRTTVRSILNRLDEAGIIEWSGRNKRVLRTARRNEYYSEAETASAGEKLSSRFMEYILKGELAPGSALHESELMKQFGVSSTVIREFLIRFSRFGLIEKERNRHWILRGFTRDFAEELFEVRELFERRAFERFLELGRENPAHQAVVAMRPEHEAILGRIDEDFLLFPRVDERFHRIWINKHNNRFFLDFFELISLVFHYHYRWNRSDEKERNRDAILQHLAIIEAIDRGDLEKATDAFSEHLGHAKGTMIASALWS